MRRLGSMNDSSLPKLNYSGKKKAKTISFPEDMMRDIKRLADHYNLNEAQVVLFILDKDIPKEIANLDSLTKEL